MPRLPDAVLLDLDGTLIDSEPVHAEAIARCMATHGIDLSQAERDYVIGHAWQEIHAFIRALPRAGLSLEALMEGTHLARLAMHEEGIEMPVLEGARELIDTLARLRIPTVIVSGSSRREIAMALSALGVSDPSPLPGPGRRGLEFYLGSDDYPRGKPAPDGYLLAADKLDVATDRCLVFEDSEAGIDSGLRAGMRVVATSAANPSPGTSGHQDQGRAHVRVDGLAGIDEDFLAGAMA